MTSLAALRIPLSVLIPWLTRGGASAKALARLAAPLEPKHRS